MSATQKFSIASIPADGVGKEVVAAGRRVLDALAEHSNGKFAFDWTEFPWGCELLRQDRPDDGPGRPGAPQGLRRHLLRRRRLGERPGPHQPLGPAPEHLQNFDQWANIRPVKFLPGVQSPLRKADDTELDWVVVRENSEGEYAGLGGRNLSGRGPGNEVALQTALFTEKGCERIMRFAFDLARTRTRQEGLQRHQVQRPAVRHGAVGRGLQARRPGLPGRGDRERAGRRDERASSSCTPRTSRVVVASNLNADILSDLGSALAGSLGLAASANLNPERRFPSMFEPVHGSAPDIAGQGISNPIGAIASAALMLDHFGLHEEARRVEAAIEADHRRRRT